MQKLQHIHAGVGAICQALSAQLQARADYTRIQILSGVKDELFRTVADHVYHRTGYRVSTPALYFPDYPGVHAEPRGWESLYFYPHLALPLYDPQ